MYNLSEYSKNQDANTNGSLETYINIKMMIKYISIGDYPLVDLGNSTSVNFEINKILLKTMK